jgi:ethanolamine utilization cobalamin adenosyltransferase
MEMDETSHHIYNYMLYRATGVCLAMIKLDEFRTLTEQASQTQQQLELQEKYKKLLQDIETISRNLQNKMEILQQFNESIKFLNHLESIYFA